MEGERVIRLREARVEPVLYHRLGATNALLGGLDDEDDGALPPVLHRRQPPGGADHRGDVGIVPTGVHHRCVDAVDADLMDLAGIGETGFLLDRQSVHVGADQDGGTIAVAQHADDAGLADLLRHHHARHLAQFGGHTRAGLELAERQLGIAVEPVPGGAEILGIVGAHGGGVIGLGERGRRADEGGGGEQQVAHIIPLFTPVLARRPAAPS